MFLVAAAVGLAFAFLLYFRNKRQHYGKAVTAVLFTFRALLGFGVTLLAFNPYVRQKVSVEEQPVLVLAHDNSASVALSKDSAFYKSEYVEKLLEFREALRLDFHVDEYAFGQEVRNLENLDFSDQLTDLSSLLQSLERKYYKRNVGAVVLFSDGIYNRGFEPSLLAEQFAFPIHTVVLGDTLSYPDLFVKEVHYNKKVSLESTYPVRVVVGAVDCQGEKALLTLSEGGRVIARQELEVNALRYSKEVDFMLEADKEGVHQLEVEVKGVDGESQLLNNVKRIFIEVRDQAYKVLCLAESPHPDLGALRSALNSDCEMDFVFGREALPDLSEYQLLILHQTPSNHTDMASLVEQLEHNKKIPMLVIVGGATSLNALNKLQQAMEIRGGAANTLLDAKAVVNTSFNTFTLSETLREKLGAFPPLAMPYMEITPLSNHDDLLLQEVLGVKSGLPLMSFAKGDRKMVFLFGTNLWRWRLYNYYQDHNSQVFNELFSKTLKYLLMNADEGLSVFAKEECFSNEAVTFTAEVRNPSGELVTEPELGIQVVDKKTGAVYEYVFSKRDHDYELNAGVLPEGLYTYRAQTEVAGRKLSASGSFSVVSLGIEAQQLTADVGRMRSIATATNGKCYTVDQMQQLLEDLGKDARITSVTHHENRFEDLIHSKWIFFVLLGLAAVEWVVRKWVG